jgi:peptidyl-tRNA hydrolase
VRKDLTPGAKLAQSVHAAFRFASDWRHTMNKWMDNSEYICILEAENEDKLTSLLEKAAQEGIPHASFREPDFDNSLTAIALGPGAQSKKLCSNLPLALRETK